MTIILSLTMHRSSSLTVLSPPSRGADCNYLLAILEPSLEWLIVFPCLAHSSHLLGLKVNSPFPSFGLVLLCLNRRLSIFICTITFIPRKYYFICLSGFSHYLQIHHRSGRLTSTTLFLIMLLLWLGYSSHSGPLSVLWISPFDHTLVLFHYPFLFPLLSSEHWPFLSFRSWLKYQFLKDATQSKVGTQILSYHTISVYSCHSPVLFLLIHLSSASAIEYILQQNRIFLSFLVLSYQGQC